MKVRLTQPGFQNYTGQLGVIFFEDGLSTDVVSKMDAMRLAAVMNAEWEDGSGMSPTQAIIDKADTPAPVLTERERGTDEQPGEQGGEGASTEEQTDSAEFTREQLEQIADSRGIAGLREIAAPKGIKANSVEKLIERLLNPQAPVSEE